MVERFLQVLDFLSRDDTARSQWALAVLVSLWQAGASSFHCPVPSLVLVCPTDEGSYLLDPIFDAFGHNPDNAMRGASGEDQRLLEEYLEGLRQMPSDRDLQDALQTSSCPTRDKVFGSDRIRSYRYKKHQDYGATSPQSGHRIHSLTSFEDVALFQGDILSGEENPFRPAGIHVTGQWVQKICPVLGWLHSARWNCDLVHACLKEGYQVLFAPVTATPRDHIPHRKVIREFLMLMFFSLGNGNEVLRRLESCGDDPEVKQYENSIRCLSSGLPLQYQFFILETIRGLHSVTLLLTRWLTRQRGTQEKPLGDLCHELYCSALRGILLGLASLQFHGYNIGISFAAQSYGEELEALRDSETPMTRRLFQRRFPKYRQEDRDKLLDHFARNGLVHLAGKSVHATGFDQFLACRMRDPLCLAPRRGRRPPEDS